MIDMEWIQSVKDVVIDIMDVNGANGTSQINARFPASLPRDELMRSVLALVASMNKPLIGWALTPNVDGSVTLILPLMGSMSFFGTRPSA